MRKTASQVESDVYAILQASELKTAIKGIIYKAGTRPHDSMSEDAVITFISGIDDDIQTGAVNVNVYIKDIDNKGINKVKNITRCREIESVLNQIIQTTKTTDYKFSLGATIQSFEAEGTSSHFVSAKIKFKLPTF